MKPFNKFAIFTLLLTSMVITACEEVDLPPDSEAAPVYTLDATTGAGKVDLIAGAGSFAESYYFPYADDSVLAFIVSFIDSQQYGNGAFYFTINSRKLDVTKADINAELEKAIVDGDYTYEFNSIVPGQVCVDWSDANRVWYSSNDCMQGGSGKFTISGAETIYHEGVMHRRVNITFNCCIGVGPTSLQQSFSGKATLAFRGK